MQPCVGTDIKKVVAWLQISLKEAQQIPIKPLGSIHQVFGDDAVGISGVKSAAEHRLEKNGFVGAWQCPAVLHPEPTEGAQQGGDTVGPVARGVPDLAEDSEVGRQAQNESGLRAL
jgi:hypothetical protein